MINSRHKIINNDINNDIIVKRKKLYDDIIYIANDKNRNIIDTTYTILKIVLDNINICDAEEIGAALSLMLKVCDDKNLALYEIQCLKEALDIAMEDKKI